MSLEAEPPKKRLAKTGRLKREPVTDEEFWAPQISQYDAAMAKIRQQRQSGGPVGYLTVIGENLVVKNVE